MQKLNDPVSDRSQSYKSPNITGKTQKDKGTKTLCRAAWYDLLKEDIDAGLELEQRIGKFMEQYIHPLIIQHHYSNQACDRFLGMLGGWAEIGDKLRWPYRSVPLEYVNQVKPAAIELIPEFFNLKV